MPSSPPSFQLQREARYASRTAGSSTSTPADSARRARREGFGTRASTGSGKRLSASSVFPKPLRGQLSQDRGRRPPAPARPRGRGRPRATVAVRPPPPRTPAPPGPASDRPGYERSPAGSRARRGPRRSASRYCRPLAAARAARGGSGRSARAAPRRAPRAPPSQRRWPPGRPPAPRMPSPGRRGRCSHLRSAR